jgi:hypothetical protein
MISKRTVIIAVIVGGLLLAASGPRTLLLFGPGTVGWIITIIAGSSASSRPIHTLFGIVAGLLMLVQFAVLSVLMIGFAEYEETGDSKLGYPSVFIFIAVFVFYVGALVSYFGRGPRTRPNKSLQATAAAPASCD